MAKKKKTEKKEEVKQKKTSKTIKREVLKDEKTVVETKIETPVKEVKAKPARRQPSLKFADYEFTDKEVVALKSFAEIHYKAKNKLFKGKDLTQEKLDELLKDIKFISRINHLLPKVSKK